MLTVEGLCRVKLEMFTIGAAGQSGQWSLNS